jgi:hypothetical protein
VITTTPTVCKTSAATPLNRQRHLVAAIAVAIAAVALATACTKNTSSVTSSKEPTKDESADAVFKSGNGRIMVTDTATLDDHKFQVSDGKLITPFNVVGTLRDFSYPAATCKGVEDKDSRYEKPERFLFCKSKVAEKVAGYTATGDPLSYDVEPGKWYYRFEFYSKTGKSPIIQRISFAGPFFNSQESEVAHRAAISGKSQAGNDSESASTAPASAQAGENDGEVPAECKDKHLMLTTIWTNPKNETGAYDMYSVKGKALLGLAANGDVTVNSIFTMTDKGERYCMANVHISGEYMGSSYDAQGYMFAM